MPARSIWILLESALLALFLTATAQPMPLPLPILEEGPTNKSEQTSTTKVKVQRLDLSAAIGISVPSPQKDLQAVAYQTPDGRTGWVLRLPGGKPIATPAYADGMLFVGGGYGSHEFYAIDADTGGIVWRIQTGDDGPPAAVVADGYVAFNTESCTLIVVKEKTGEIIWQEWLGDPLMSQPAIDRGVLYMAYPAEQRESPQRKRQDEFHPQPATPGGSHRLLALDLKTGRHLWQQQIAADVMTAPVISDGTVYFTTFDGTSYALKAVDGSAIWVKKDSSTSAPVIFDGQVIQTKKEQRGNQVFEGITRKDANRGIERDSAMLASEKAEYLEKNRGGGVALAAHTQANWIRWQVLPQHHRRQSSRKPMKLWV
jgi:outer membrane protein assembly factor BamB